MFEDFPFLVLVAILFNGGELLWPSWISDRHHFSSFWSRNQKSCCYRTNFGSRRQKVWEEMSKIVLAFKFVSTKRPNAHHQVSIQMDYRGDVQNMNSQYFSHINVQGPYKCMEKQIWPCRKMVKHQFRTITLAILVDLLSPMFCTKIRPLGLEKKIFKGFYHIWAWQQSWLMDHDHFSNLSFPFPKEAPHEIWARLVQKLQRRSRLKFSTFFPYNVWCPYKCIREANLTLL